MNQNNIEGDENIKGIDLKAGWYTEGKLVEKVCTDKQKESYQRKKKFVNTKQREMFLDRLSCYCTYEIDEVHGKYKIKQVFEFPKVVEERKIHKGIYQYLAPLILNNLLNNGDERSIVFSSFRLAEDCYMVNQNYKSLKFNQQAVETDLNIPKKQVAEYFNKADNSIDEYIHRCLKYLNATNCLIFLDVYLIQTFEEEFESSNENNAVINHRKYSDLRVATEEEIDLYTKLVEIASNDSGVRNNKDKWYGKSSPKYRARLSELFRENHIRCMYKGFQIWKVNTKRCNEIFDSFSDKSIAEYQQGIGIILKSIIDTNAKERKIENEQYLENFKELSEITLLYGQPKIYLKSAKSYAERLQDEAANISLIIIEE